MARDKSLLLLNIDDAGAATTTVPVTIDGSNDGPHTSVDLGSAGPWLFRVEFRLKTTVTGTTPSLQITIQQSSDNSNWPADTDESTDDNIGFSPKVVTGMNQLDPENESNATVGAKVFYFRATKRYIRANATLGNADNVAAGVSLDLIPQLEV